MRSISPMLRHDSSGVFGNIVSSMEEGDVDGVAASVPGIMRSKSLNSKTLNRTISSNIVRLKPCRNLWSGLVLFFSLSVSSNIHIFRDLQHGKVAYFQTAVNFAAMRGILCRFRAFTRVSNKPNVACKSKAYIYIYICIIYRLVICIYRYTCYCRSLPEVHFPCS